VKHRGRNDRLVDFSVVTLVDRFLLKCRARFSRVVLDIADCILRFFLVTRLESRPTRARCCWFRCGVFPFWCGSRLFRRASRIFSASSGILQDLAVRLPQVWIQVHCHFFEIFLFSAVCFFLFYQAFYFLVDQLYQLEIISCDDRYLY